MTDKLYRWFDRISPIMVYLPWWNLGCLGIRVGYKMFYADIYREPCWAIYCRIRSSRWTIPLRTMKPKKWR